MTPNEEAAHTLAVKALCRLHGLKWTSSLDLHEWLITYPGPHELDELRDEFEMSAPNLWVCAQPLIEMGLIVEVGGGAIKGRRGHTKKSYKATGRQPIRKKLEAQARKMLKVVA